ncbi:hypothetical protein MPTK1_4g00100 [Marchantia polymorpha subsp. ruderalis]|nr:hypothetical protein MARPO_0162s0011 [Marchantia polymorpha]PTQ28481.1 hypothetical protein MARPO_0162s0011 [Marchantia polymorpha]BBN06996.1 hypothetical protein Mp_4g00100 [Marchantia polymorpha subsp. ruderalis]BBN06997.1 hypothetical protein Mp_4g00100 [Marchantia polymorpha subsp. ruderalis]|eukprot:PTQ28480.1 hypothetical protein MARPO_0162s0011 [Marchantia polymorpha]
MDALDQGRVHPHHYETYEHTKNVKKGSERLDRRSAAGVHGQPKKSGHGGKFTWGGPTAQQESQDDDSVVALDEKDPNYDDEEEVASEDRKAAIAAGADIVVEAGDGKQQPAKKVPVAN